MGFRVTRHLKALLFFFLFPVCIGACTSYLLKPLRYDTWFAKTPSPTRQAEKTKPSCTAPQTRAGSGFSFPPPDGTLAITLSDAILLGLGNNREFRVDRYQPAITATGEQEEAALFDPLLDAETEYLRERSGRDSIDLDYEASTKVSQFFSSGTTVDMEARTEFAKTLEDPGGSSRRNRSTFSTQDGISVTTQDPDSDWRSQLKLSVTQALLQGRGADVNLATLRQARLDTSISLYELQGKAESLAARIETIYWDHYLALGQVEINRRSLAFSRQLIRETRERIRLGQRARSEIYAIQAEAATTEQALIAAQSQLEKTRLQLLRLVNPPSMDLWNRKLKLLTLPKIPGDRFEDLGDHVRLALLLRPDLNQARLLIERGNLEVVKTGNGLLPKLDLFIELGRTGYARSFSGSVNDITEGAGGLDFLVGSKFEYPLLNRKAKAQYNKSVFDLGKQKEALSNLTQLVEEDIYLAYVEIRRASQEMRASSSTVRYQREKRDAEVEKFRLGKSGMFRVTQAERDLVLSQLSHLQSRMDFLKGLTQFYFVEGSLLARRGIRLPRRGP